MPETVERVTYRIPEVMQATGLNREAVYVEIRSGRLPIVKLGRRTLVTADALRSWAERLQAETAGA